MIIVILVVLGLALGSFVNALVWRVHEQANEQDKKKPSKKYLKELSVSKGRSMCPDCKQTLAAKDLIPVLSWVSTKGKCRYCQKSISAQYPIVELATAGLFVASYIWWPEPVEGLQVAALGLWLLALTGLMALLAYDARWFLLPNRIMLPTGVIAVLLACVRIAASPDPFRAVIDTALAVLVGGGIFYVLFQVSQGKWIGGGDVKLGWIIGLLVGAPSKSILVIFVASLAGVLVSLPLMKIKRLSKNSLIPFGPFLIIGTIVAVLFGQEIINLYTRTFIGI